MNHQDRKLTNTPWISNIRDRFFFSQSAARLTSPGKRGLFWCYCCCLHGARGIIYGHWCQNSGLRFLFPFSEIPGGDKHRRTRGEKGAAGKTEFVCVAACLARLFFACCSSLCRCEIFIFLVKLAPRINFIDMSGCILRGRQPWQKKWDIQIQ